MLVNQRNFFSVLLFSALLAFVPAVAQDRTPDEARGSTFTGIEADQAAGTIRIIIGGEQRALFDADGLHVVGSIDYTGTLTDISDQRLKTDIRPLPGQSGNIGSLEPVAFSMAADPSRRTEYGLIAQEVESVYPDLVQTLPGGAKAVNYVGLIAPLIAAVQELQADNARLRARIEALEAAPDRQQAAGSQP